MTEFDFTLTVEALDILDDDVVDALFDAGCDDATLVRSDGRSIAVFHRRSTDFAAAVGSAIAQIEKAVPGSRVVSVERTPAAARSA